MPHILRQSEYLRLQTPEWHAFLCLVWRTLSRVAGWQMPLNKNPKHTAKSTNTEQSDRPNVTSVLSPAHSTVALGSDNACSSAWGTRYILHICHWETGAHRDPSSGQVHSAQLPTSLPTVPACCVCSNLCMYFVGRGSSATRQLDFY